MAVANHRGEVLARDLENLRRFLGNGVPRRADESRVGQHPRDVATPPLEHLVASGATVHIDGDVAREHDEKAGNRHAFRAQHLSLVEQSKRSVRRQPGELLARRRAERLVFGEPIQQVCHVIVPILCECRKGEECYIT